MVTFNFKSPKTIGGEKTGKIDSVCIMVIKDIVSP